MSGRFVGQTAIVTGAGSGLGEGIALRLATEGAKVIVADIRSEEGIATVEQIEASGGKAQFVRCDVTQSSDVTLLAERAAASGSPRVLINNAGAALFGAVHKLPESDWDAALNLCLKSVYLCSKAVLPLMIASGGGAIVNIASIYQRVSQPGLASYTAAKGGVVALTKQMAVEYGPNGIRCNTVSPGWIRTPATESRLEGDFDLQMLLACHPVGRLGTVQDVAAAVAFLASHEAGFISGAELVVDGASTCVATLGLLRSSGQRGVMKRSNAKP